MERWTWEVDTGAGPELEFAVKTAQFGNGYAQEVQDGLNAAKEVWNISRFGDLSVLAPMYKFLKRHGGTKAFQWLTPFGEEILVKATNIKMPNQGANTYTLSATFAQVFRP